MPKEKKEKKEQRRVALPREVWEAIDHVSEVELHCIHSIVIEKLVRNAIKGGTFSGPFKAQVRPS